ncbi:MAG: sulfate adenylyltransferase subunit CysN [Capsulimonas sp.]|uniref:sulfate adenylyltransferase subunit CysN n=1 Tax=Capsulimonas sp. TaxID=2494211 RepID=UPI0032658F95
MNEVLEPEFTSAGYLDMELLRFTTAGSVDDGKSTLIGRLLYDSKSIFDDQYDAIKESSEKRGEEYVNLALLTDGLRAEREQGITIDVAYRYFATPKRKFIIADTPGHIQYTRNMVTGASTANLAIILIDARKGVIEQTCRHTIIASLLRIPHVVVCVNKMDLVEYKQEVFESIRRDFEAFASHLEVTDLHFIPISALNGDNVVDRSKNMDWYDGSTLLSVLETTHISSDHNHLDARFPVQYVIRPQSTEHHDYRGYAGRIAGGVFKPGDAVTVQPSGFTSRVKSVDTFTESLSEAFAPMSVTLTLEDEIDISRGDTIVGLSESQPQVSQDLEIMICWLNERKLALNGKYTIKHTTREARCIVKDIQYKLNISNMERITDDNDVNMNDIARITLRTTQPLVFDKYARNRITGSVILIDEATNTTVGAGMIV